MGTDETPEKTYNCKQRGDQGMRGAIQMGKNRKRYQLKNEAQTTGEEYNVRVVAD